MNRLRSQKQSPAADAPSEASKPRSTRLSAGQIYDNIRVAAQEELRRPAAALFWSASAAGLTIGFSFLAGAYLMAIVPAAYSGAATAVGYPLGFVFVVLARGQLFTENTLEPIIPLLHAPTLKTLRQLLSLWVVVLIGNLAGACAFAAIVALTPMLGETLRPTLIAVAKTGTDGGFWLVALRAIYAGWLIALMAWLIASTRATGAQVLLIWLTTAPISALGFRHSVAGSVEAFYRAFEHTAGWREMAGSFILPAVAGNIVGGFVFVALLNHGQVAADRAGDPVTPDK
jgi:formate/nitrite transporter FocA (FNT family)